MTQTIQTERSPLGFAVAAIVNFVFLLALNAHEVWRPWLRGVVTDAYVDVLWAANLSVVVQIFGNLILAVTSPRPLRRVMDLVFAIAALVGAVVFYRVFPLDLSRFGEPAMVIARVVLLLGVIGASIAVLVNLIRILSSGGTRPTPAHP